MTPRSSISRLADCAPAASPESWAGRKAPRTSSQRSYQSAELVESQHPAPCIDTTPAMNAAHAAIEAWARRTAIRAIKYRAHLYALHPRELDAIADGLSGVTPRELVASLRSISLLIWADLCPKRIGFGAEVPAINLRGASLYARYLRAKARQVAGRAA